MHTIMYDTYSYSVIYALCMIFYIFKINSLLIIRRRIIFFINDCLPMMYLQHEINHYRQPKFDLNHS